MRMGELRLSPSFDAHDFTWRVSRYEAELQLIHYKSSYDNFTAAVAANQSDSLAIVAILIKEGGKFGSEHIPYPESIMELLYKAGELSQSEIDTPIEMEVTLDQFVSNIGYVKPICSRLWSQSPFEKQFCSFQWSTRNVSLRGLLDKPWV